MRALRVLFGAVAGLSIAFGLLGLIRVLGAAVGMSDPVAVSFVIDQTLLLVVGVAVGILLYTRPKP